MTVDIQTFFKTQGPNILTLVVLFFTLLTLFKIIGVDFNPKVDKHISKVVTVESMGLLEDRDSKCQRLNSNRHCTKSHCVWVTNKADGTGHCVGGSRDGATYPFDKYGVRIYTDDFYYKGKHYK